MKGNRRKGPEMHGEKGALRLPFLHTPPNPPPPLLASTRQSWAAASPAGPARLVFSPSVAPAQLSLVTSSCHSAFYLLF